ncbi:MAG: hypothetical protein Q7S48_02585 [bacterium]|nr:hypothetical protein [bacterium]
MSLQRIGICFVVLALFGYLGIHIVTLLLPPSLSIAFPPEGFTTSSHTIEIAGKTAPGAQVEVNGSPLPSPASGEFKHLLVLDRGLTTITVSARKRHSKSAVIERQIFILEGEKISQADRGGI